MSGGRRASVMAPRSEPRTTLLTGATGFVGSHVSRALIEAGRPARGLVRADSRSLECGIEPAPAQDLLDRDGLRKALAGVGTVIHLAGRVDGLSQSVGDSLSVFRRINVEGTRVLLEEAISAGVGCFVYLSSVKAVRSESTTVISDGTPPAPDTPYGVSKLEAEQVVRRLACRAGIRAPILRSPLVYGPRMKGNLLRLFELIDRGIPLPLASVRNRRSVVYVENLVAAIHAVLDSPTAADETCFVSDGQDLSTPDLMSAIARALGKPARLFAVPPVMLRLGGLAGDLLSRLVPCPVTSDAVNRLVGSLVVDASKLMRATGFHPPYSVDDGLQRTAEWYRTRKRDS